MSIPLTRCLRLPATTPEFTIHSQEECSDTLETFKLFLEATALVIPISQVTY